MSIKVIAGDATNTVLQIPKGVASQIQKMCRNIFHHLRYVNVVYNEEMKSGDLVLVPQADHGNVGDSGSLTVLLKQLKTIKSLNVTGQTMWFGIGTKAYTGPNTDQRLIVWVQVKPDLAVFKPIE